MSDLKEKIKEFISDVEIDSGDGAGYVSLNRESVIEVSDSITALLDTHAAERAVAFGKFISKADWTYSPIVEKWFRMEKGYAVNWKTDADLYALFDEETKTK